MDASAIQTGDGPWPRRMSQQSRLSSKASIQEEELWFEENLPQRRAPLPGAAGRASVPRVNIPGNRRPGNGAATSMLGQCFLEPAPTPKVFSWTVQNGMIRPAVTPRTEANASSGACSYKCVVPFWWCGDPGDHVRDTDDTDFRSQVISAMPVVSDADWRCRNPEYVPEPQSEGSAVGPAVNSVKRPHRSCDTSDLCGDAQADTCWDRKTEQVFRHRQQGLSGAY